jgi:hypothetical protein
MKSSVRTVPSLVVTELRSNYAMGKAIVDFLIYAGTDSPSEVTQAALGDFHAILDDTERLLQEAFPGGGASLQASRLPQRPEKPLTPKEALEALETTLDLMQIEVEALLRQPWATDEEYRRISIRRDHVITMMGHMARYYKAVIVRRDPTVWTPEVEKRFAKFIRIKP